MGKHKIDGAEYEARKEDLRQVIDHQGPDAILEKYKANPVRTLFDLYHKACFDRRNDDEHPFFITGRDERILPFKSQDYELYPNGSDDRHLDTMLKRAIHELLPATKNVDRSRSMSSGPSM